MTSASRSRPSSTQFTSFPFDLLGGSTLAFFSSTIPFLVAVNIITAMIAVFFDEVFTLYFAFLLSFAVHLIIAYCRYTNYQSTPYKNCVLYKKKMQLGLNVLSPTFVFKRERKTANLPATSVQLSFRLNHHLRFLPLMRLLLLIVPLIIATTKDRRIAAAMMRWVT